MTNHQEHHWYRRLRGQGPAGQAPQGVAGQNAQGVAGQNAQGLANQNAQGLANQNAQGLANQNAQGFVMPGPQGFVAAGAQGFTPQGIQGFVPQAPFGYAGQVPLQGLMAAPNVQGFTAPGSQTFTAQPQGLQGGFPVAAGGIQPQGPPAGPRGNAHNPAITKLNQMRLEKKLLQRQLGNAHKRIRGLQMQLQQRERAKERREVQREVNVRKWEEIIVKNWEDYRKGKEEGYREGYEAGFQTGLENMPARDAAGSLDDGNRPDDVMTGDSAGATDDMEDDGIRVFGFDDDASPTPAGPVPASFSPPAKVAPHQAYAKDETEEREEMDE